MIRSTINTVCEPRSLDSVRLLPLRSGNGGYRPSPRAIDGYAVPRRSAFLGGKALPAVVRALTLLWGHPEMNQYFEKVWSGRDPSLNLDPESMAEVMLLAAIHQRVCPYRPAKSVEDLYGTGRWADTWKPARVRR